MQPFTPEEMKTQIKSLQSEVERLQTELQLREELLQNLVSYVYSEMGTPRVAVKRENNAVEFSTPVGTKKAVT
jgi:Holliday junction resolvase